MGAKYGKNGVDGRLTLSGDRLDENVAVPVNRKIKYNTAICAIVRNEGRYIAEWISYHRKIGIGHVFLYDNESDDNTREILSKFILEGFVTAIQWPSNRTSNPQRLAYQHFADTFAQCVNWLIYLDGDELINIKKYNNIDSFLADYPDVSGVAINWRMFGDGGEGCYRPGLIIDRFKQASESNFFGNKLVKTFVKVDDMVRPDIHNPEMKAGKITITANRSAVQPFPVSHSQEIHHDIAQINHYFVKSPEEWTVKRLRGKADSAYEAADRFRPDGEFGVYNRNDEVETSILKWRDAVAADLIRLGLLAEI